MNNLTWQEQQEIDEYINIFEDFNFQKHYEVNNYISKNKLWDRFPTIRAENTHENGAIVDGISPKYFAIVCRLVGMEYGGGSNLIKSERY